MSEALENTNVGDVLYCKDYGNTRLWTVTKVTTHFVTCGHTKFNRSGRSTSGDIWHRVHVRPVTAEILSEENRKRLVREINEMTRGNLLIQYPLEVMEKIHATLKEYAPKEAKP